MIKSDNSRLQSNIELFAALVITGLACCAGFFQSLVSVNGSVPADDRRDGPNGQSQVFGGMLCPWRVSVLVSLLV